MIKSQYRTKCGGVVVLPPKTIEHLEAHPEVGGLLQEAMSLLELPRDGSFLAREIDFGRLVGRTGCVSAPTVDLGSEATFALRVGRRKPSRVVVGVQGPEVSTVVVLAFADRQVKGTYVLITAYVGQLAPKEPWDAAPGAEREEAFKFWSQQALIHDPAVMGEVFVSNWQSIIGS